MDEIEKLADELQDYADGLGSAPIIMHDRAELYGLLARAAAALRLAVPEWRPIETAPTDETVVMAYFGPDEAMREFTSVARFFKWECMTERLLSGWPSQRRKPTHWAPLPAAPTVSAEGEG